MVCLILFIAFSLLIFLLSFYINIKEIDLVNISQEEIDSYLFNKTLRYDNIY